MIKIGKLLPILIIFLSVLSSQPSFSQDVEVNATVNENVVFQGDRIVLTVSVSGNRFRNVNEPELPDLNGLTYLSTSPSTSTSYSFVNGVSKSSYSYSYYLVTGKEGDFTIPPISVTIDKKTYQTKALAISVKPRSQVQGQGQEQNSPDIYLKVEISNQKPFAGEQVVAKIVLYFKNSLEILSYQPSPDWKAEGFWKEELSDGKQPQVESAIINGMRYRKAELVKYALFPSKTGKLTISPFAVTAVVRVASRNQDPFSSFFGGFGTNRRNIDLQTDPLTIDVKPVPEITEAHYTGAVGNFTISRSVAKNEAFVGESVEVITKVSGTGNIALVGRQNYEYPGSFEIYDPQENANINRKGDVVTGTKTFTDILIPRTPGKYSIPAVKISYFNPQKKRHEILSLPEINLNIKKDPRATILSAESVSFSIQPIMGLVHWLPKQATAFYQSWFFYVIVSIPLVGIGFLSYYRGYLDKMEGDVQYARSNKASKKAEKRLAEAHKLAQSDIKMAYSALSKALVGYVADRAHVPETGESETIYLDILKEKNLANLDIQALGQLWEKCNTIRFAPLTSIEDYERDLALATELLKKIRRVI